MGQSACASLSRTNSCRMWIGGEEKGMVLDGGWTRRTGSMDAKKPSLEIVREKENIILQANLSNKKPCWAANASWCLA